MSPAKFLLIVSILPIVGSLILFPLINRMIEGRSERRVFRAIAVVVLILPPAIAYLFTYLKP